MKNNLLLFFSLLILSDIQAQANYDYNWIFASNSIGDFPIESTRFTWNDGFDILEDTSSVSIPRTNSTMSDKLGNLVYYTNGMAVLNRDNEVMPNGGELNINDYTIEQFDNQNHVLGYLLYNDIMSLSDPSNEDGYFIVHKNINYTLEPEFRFFIEDMMYSYVDMRLDDGLGDLTLKNEKIVGVESVRSSFLTGTYERGKDYWWVLQPKEDSDIYYKILLGAGGVMAVDSQSIGPIMPELMSATGRAAFSPDGTKYAIASRFIGLWLYDFDNETGLLSNPRSMPLNDFENLERANVEFARNSRLLYLNKRDKLWQIDTWEEDLEDGKVLIDIRDGEANPVNTVFAIMQLAPDCKIYMCSYGSTSTYHVINDPDSLGLGCNFVQRGIELPYLSAGAAIPEFPTFRDDVCDPDLVSSLSEISKEEQDLLIEVFPNPTSGDVWYTPLEGFRIKKIDLYSMQGELIRGLDLDDSSNRLELSGFPTGVYILKATAEKDGKVYTESKRIVRM